MKKIFPIIILLAAIGGGIWWWRDTHAPDDAPVIRSCTIITTPASQDMDGIHDRMPVILNPDMFDLWLDPANHATGRLTPLLKAAPAGTVVPAGSRSGAADSQELGGSVRRDESDHVACAPRVRSHAAGRSGQVVAWRACRMTLVTTPGTT